MRTEGGTDWYAKWIATVIIIAAVICRSLPEVSKFYDVGLSLLGTILWFYVGILWKDRALITLNSILMFILFVGFLEYII